MKKVKLHELILHIKPYASDESEEEKNNTNISLSIEYYYTYHINYYLNMKINIDFFIYLVFSFLNIEYLKINNI